MSDSETTGRTKPYQYFDTPDGEDIPEKLWYCLGPTSKICMMLGTADVMLVSHAKPVAPVLMRYVRVGWPLMASSTLFVLGTNGAARVRGKDDWLNWFIGGFSAGSVFGIPFRRPMIGFNMAMFLGLGAIIQKYCHDMGWRLMIPTKSPNQVMGIWDYDWTLTSERPRNWTTGK